MPLPAPRPPQGADDRRTRHVPHQKGHVRGPAARERLTDLEQRVDAVRPGHATHDQQGGPVGPHQVAQPLPGSAGCEVDEGDEDQHRQDQKDLLEEEQPECHGARGREQPSQAAGPQVADPGPHREEERGLDGDLVEARDPPQRGLGGHRRGQVEGERCQDGPAASEQARPASRALPGWPRPGRPGSPSPPVPSSTARSFPPARRGRGCPASGGCCRRRGGSGR